MQCVVTWRGLGAKHARQGYLYECVCPIPAQGDSTGPNQNVARNLDAQFFDFRGCNEKSARKRERNIRGFRTLMPVLQFAFTKCL